MEDNSEHTLSGMLAINKRLQRENIKCRLLTDDFNNFWALLSRPCASPVVWRERGGGGEVCSSGDAGSFSSTERSASSDGDKVCIR